MLVTNKTKVVQIRLVEADYDKLVQLAAKDQITMSEWLRRAIIKAS